MSIFVAHGKSDANQPTLCTKLLIFILNGSAKLSCGTQLVDTAAQALVRVVGEQDLSSRWLTCPPLEQASISALNEYPSSLMPSASIRSRKPSASRHLPVHDARRFRFSEAPTRLRTAKFEQHRSSHEFAGFFGEPCGRLIRRTHCATNRSPLVLSAPFFPPLLKPVLLPYPKIVANN